MCSVSTDDNAFVHTQAHTIGKKTISEIGREIQTWKQLVQSSEKSKYSIQSKYDDEGKV